MDIWLASSNKHKQKEVQGFLKDWTVKIPSDAGIDFDPAETGSTFLDNAFIKARDLYRLLAKPVIADDSGLCVDALNGRPGIYSARYGADNGEKLQDSDRNALLLREMEPFSLRSACFVCAMVLIVEKNRFFAVQETLEGEITKHFCGENGFGFDPIFYLPQKKCNLAELGLDEKNKLSHRGKALCAVEKVLQSLI
ncbi:MAG: RdgB/HAM1 family non-canonical purine NTP pyrophosphatase [Termitinemataceae bacterium]|nr:MAG: RdgB/HAM1 family non-canonical purine NTP pyrophosphatase [Termitinemataceae bacterium]